MSARFTRNSSELLSSGATPITGVPYTIAAWVYWPNHNTGDLNVFNCGLAQSDQEWAGLGHSSTEQAQAFIVDTGVNDPTWDTGSPSLNSAWHHVVGTYIADDSRELWVDGVRTATDGSLRTPTAFTDIVFANPLSDGPDNTPAGDGDLNSHVAFYNKALSGSEIGKLYRGGYKGQYGAPPTEVAPENLVAYYPFVDDFRDYSGNNYHLTNSGTVTISNNNAPVAPDESILGPAVIRRPWTRNKFRGVAGSFDGSTHRVTDGDPPITTAANGISMSAWVRCPGAVGERTIMSLGRNGSQGYWRIGLSTSETALIQAQQDDGVSKSASGNIRLDDGKWHHILGLWTSSTREVLTDGLDLVAATSGTDTDPTVSFVTVGALRRDSTIHFWQGDIFEPVMWNTLLSYGEGARLAAGEDPRTIRRGAIRFFIPDLSGPMFDIVRQARIWDQTASQSPIQTVPPKPLQKTLYIGKPKDRRVVVF